MLFANQLLDLEGFHHEVQLEWWAIGQQWLLQVEL